jgi:hypothetical protein
MSINQPILNSAQITEITNYVNAYRIVHQSPPLKWNAAIATFSQQWSYYLNSNNLFQHSSTKLYGENLAMFQGYGSDVMTLLKKSVDNWYAEISAYDFNKPAFSSATGHFTCLVWKNSTDFGMGFSINTTNNLVDITFNTSPPGNVIGKFQQNVLPKIGTVPVPVPVPSPIPSPIPVPVPAPVPPPVPSPIPVPVPAPVPSPVPSPVPPPVPSPVPAPSNKTQIITNLNYIITLIQSYSHKYVIYSSIYAVISLVNNSRMKQYSNTQLTSQLYNIIHQLYNLSNLLQKNISNDTLISTIQLIIKNINVIQFD